MGIAVPPVHAHWGTWLIVLSNGNQILWSTVHGEYSCDVVSRAAFSNQKVSLPLTSCITISRPSFSAANQFSKPHFPHLLSEGVTLDDL